MILCCAIVIWEPVYDCPTTACGAAAEPPCCADCASKAHAPPSKLHYVLLADLYRESSPTKLEVQASNVKAQPLRQAGFRQHALNPVNSFAIPKQQQRWEGLQSAQTQAQLMSDKYTTCHVAEVGSKSSFHSGQDDSQWEGTLMPYLEAILGYLSVSIFTTLTLPFISSAIPCSRLCVQYASLRGQSQAAGGGRHLNNPAACQSMRLICPSSRCTFPDLSQHQIQRWLAGLQVWLTLKASPMSLQGPHHCAWKSTSTGTSLPRTISSKLVNCCVFTASTVIVAERPTVAVPLQSNERRPWIIEARRKRGAELHSACLITGVGIPPTMANRLSSYT